MGPGKYFLGSHPLAPPIDPRRPLQLDYLRPASSRLVEHSDPAHADPSAQVPTARRDDRPAARRRTIGRKHQVIDRVRAPHNPYIMTPINARNGGKQLRQELRLRSRALRGVKKATACTVHRDSPTPYTLRQLLLLFFLCTLYPIFSTFKV